MSAVNELMAFGTQAFLAIKQIQVFGVGSTGGGGIEEAPATGLLYARNGQVGSWVPTVGEANQDSYIYGRQNGAWVIVPSGGPGGGIGEAPTTGLLYARQGSTASWVISVGEAPSGGIYARQNGGWVLAPGGGVDTVAPNVSASGSNQAGAFQLSQQFNVVTVCAVGAGVILPTPIAGQHCLVRNSAPNACNVYPPGSTTINAGAAGGAYSVPANTTGYFEASSTTQWFTVP